MSPRRVAILCLVSFAGGIGSMFAGAYLWLERRLP